MTARSSARNRLSAFRKSSTEVAARYSTGAARKVQAALKPLGTIEDYPEQRMIVLHRAAGSTAADVNKTVKALQERGSIEFVTPVLIDRESNLRQVLTDEIVLRLKPGRHPRALKALSDKHGVRIGKQNEFEPSQYIVTVDKPAGTQTLDVARVLDRSADVEFASPNFLTEFKR